MMSRDSSKYQVSHCAKLTLQMFAVICVSVLSVSPDRKCVLNNSPL